MSKARRTFDGKYARKVSLKVLLGTWIGALLSIGLVLFAARALASDIGSFRSCNRNADVLHIVNCGKQAPNFGDLAVLAFFVLCCLLALSLCNAAWRMARGGGQI